MAALQAQQGTAVDEVPTFAAASYTFDLAENADGSTDRVSLGTVAATDPEGAAPVYSLVGSNDAGLFEIDANTGELYYKGSGEYYEPGTTSYDLTVRASDGSQTADTTVTVNVTDVDEAVAVDPPAEEVGQSTPQTVSEPDGGGSSADTTTGGRVALGETATGNIGSADDRDWFAVEMMAGAIYTIDLRGRRTGDGNLSDHLSDPYLRGRRTGDGNLSDPYLRGRRTGDGNLSDPYLRGIHDADGNLIANTTDDDGGASLNSRATFTPSASGTYYIAAGAYGSHQGTYEVEVTEEVPTVQVADAEAHEEYGTIVFRVTLSSASSRTVTVSYTTADDTATAGTLTFAPGETEKTVAVPIIDDTVEDSGETFRLLLSEPSGARRDDTEATATIFNSDPPPTSVPSPTARTCRPGPRPPVWSPRSTARTAARSRTGSTPASGDSARSSARARKPQGARRGRRLRTRLRKRSGWERRLPGSAGFQPASGSFRRHILAMAPPRLPAAPRRG